MCYSNKQSKWDHAKFYLGSVNNTGVNTADWNASTIIFDWDVMMVNNTAAPNGTITWLTVGGSYFNETNIWIGQKSHMVVSDPYVRIQEIGLVVKTIYSIL